MTPMTPEDRLLERRIVMLRGELDDRAAGDTAAKLMTLDATGDEPVRLMLDATGTNLDAAFTVMDVIDALGVPVEVTGMGRIDGAAVGVLAVAPKRVLFNHATVRLRDPEFQAHGGARDLKAWLDHHEDALRRFHKRVAEAAGRRIATIEADFGAGRMLTAEEARAYGLADGIATPAPA